MASTTIRKLDEDLKQRFRVRATGNGLCHGGGAADPARCGRAAVHTCEGPWDLRIVNGSNPSAVLRWSCRRAGQCASHVVSTELATWNIRHRTAMPGHQTGEDGTRLGDFASRPFRYDAHVGCDVPRRGGEAGGGVHRGVDGRRACGSGAARRCHARGNEMEPQDGGGRAMRVRELLLASALLLSAGGDAEWTTWGRHVRQDRRLLPA